jgi:hypothetical protein
MSSPRDDAREMPMLNGSEWKVQDSKTLKRVLMGASFLDFVSGQEL